MRKLRLRALAVIMLFVATMTPALCAEIRMESLHGSSNSSPTARKEVKASSQTSKSSLSSTKTASIQGQSAAVWDLSFPSTTALAALKFLPDETIVCVSQKSVSWLNGFTFYVEEADRSAGIRAEVPTGYPTPNYIGSIVSFTGILKTDSERYVQVDPATLIEYPIAPLMSCLGMANKRVGGRPLNSLTPGLVDSIHAFNVGLLAKVWGKVKYNDRYDQQGSIIYIDDGSKIIDGSYWYSEQNLGLRIHYNGTLPDVGQFVTVVGVTGVEWWDPTPGDPLNNDQFLIPSLRTCSPSDLTVINEGDPDPPSSSVVLSTITGQVIALAEPAPGIEVRVYSLYASKIIEGVTETGSTYTLSGIPSTGVIVSANAPGYKSCSIVAIPGQSIPDLVLEPYQQLNIDVVSDKPMIRLCNTETAVIKAFVRDCEGKGVRNKSVKLATTKGSFTETGTKEYISTTNDSGAIIAHLQTTPDGEGIAQIVASDEPAAVTTDQTSVEFRGSSVQVSASPAYMTIPGSSEVKAIIYDADMNRLPGADVYFNTDAGGFVEASGASTWNTQTNSQGEATVNLQLSSPCTALVTARTTDTCGNQAVSWVVVSYRGTPWKDFTTEYSSPLIANLDNSPDGTKEVAISCTDAKLHVWKYNGSLLWEASDDFSPSAWSTPSAANIDHDLNGKLEVILPNDNQKKVNAYAGDSGMRLAGWPTNTNFPFQAVAAAIGDINLDGAYEIIAGDECCYVFSWNSTGNWEGKDAPNASVLWHNLTGSSGTVIYGSTPAIGDMDNDPDKIPDVLVGTNSSDFYGFPGNAWGEFTCTTGSCSPGVYAPLYLPDWPVVTPTYAQSSPVIGDIDGDAKNDTAVMCDRGYLRMYLSKTNAWITAKLSESPSTGPEQPDPLESSPALADMNGDGYIDLITAISEGKVFVFDGRAITDKHMLVPLDGWESGIRLNLTGNYEIRSSAAIGDVNNDGALEIVIGCSDGNLYALFADGQKHIDSLGHRTGAVAWVRSCVPSTKSTAIISSSPAIDDVDADGNVEVVVGSTGGIWLFDFNSTYHADRMPWPTFHRDNARTGSIAAPAPALKCGSIIGRLTRNGVSVIGYDVKIEYNDGTTVLQPTPDPLHPDPYWQQPRPRVRTVGNTTLNDTTEANRGLYSINQLQPGRIYRISFGVKGFTTPEKTVSNISIPAAGGVTRLDVDLAL